jgi:hypothetical protein
VSREKRPGGLSNAPLRLSFRSTRDARVAPRRTESKAWPAAPARDALLANCAWAFRISFGLRPGLWRLDRCGRLAGVALGCRDQLLWTLPLSAFGCWCCGCPELSSVEQVQGPRREEYLVEGSRCRLDAPELCGNRHGELLQAGKK